MILPPTGTMKFLSVLEIMQSILPNFYARVISDEILEHYNPYAELIIWPTLNFSQRTEISTIES